MGLAPLIENAKGTTNKFQSQENSLESANTTRRTQKGPNRQRIFRHPKNVPL